MTQNAGVAAEGRWADQISLGVLASSVPRDVIGDVVAGRGAAGEAVGWEAAAACHGVFRDGHGAVRGGRLWGGRGAAGRHAGLVGCWDARWGAPTSGGITRARERLGLSRCGTSSPGWRRRWPIS